MNVAHVDASVLTAIAFDEPDARQIAVAEALGFPRPWDTNLQ